jgi:protein SCO1/2
MSSLNNVLKKIVVLALILALPGFLYYLLTAKGKNRYDPLPYFGPKELAKTNHIVKGKAIPDTIYHIIPDFNLEDQNGKEVSLKTLTNKILIVNFFYSNCPNICNVVNQSISKLASQYEHNKITKFISITVDPQRDDVAVLKQYSRKFNADSTRRLFLTGDTSVIYPLAREGFLVNALNAGNGNFVYGDKIMLIDERHHIRGYYSGTSDDDMLRLDNEIKVQIAEEIRKKDHSMY